MRGMSIRILYLEDNPIDVRMVNAALEDGDLSCELRVVGSREDFQRALSDSFDIVLVDYRVPGYGGLAALEDVRKMHEHFPVIIVSATIGEDTAVEALKSGATDYVMKQNLSRLVPAIKRAIKEHEVFTEREKGREALADYSKELSDVNRLLIEKNRDLEEANRKLRQLDMMKTDFISMASHELRTPVTSIMGFADTLISPDMNLSDEERGQFMKIISQQSHRLSRLVNALLDLSRIDKGTFEIRRDKFDIREEIDEALKELHVPPEINVVTDAQTGGEVDADRTRVRQLLVNILDNAVRFTFPSGQIRIEMKEAGDQKLLVRIRDFGPGIPTDELERVFEKFYRSRLRMREGQGSGLGLSIAKEIVLLHGGKIWAEANPDKGASICFTLPR